MTLRIYGDFQNADPDGNIRLNTLGTEQDINQLNLKLMPGLELIITDGELEADAIVNFSEKENIWVAKIDWNKLRDLHQGH